jgi:predicted TIM-barrel fold metal-dependent hydrolase
MPSLFDPQPLLAGLTVALDIDVLIGRFPDRPGPSGDAAGVRAMLADRGVAGAAVASLRAALFDLASGNDDVLSLPESPPASVDVVAVGALDLRDPIGSASELERLTTAGVRAVRLFPDEQGVQPDFPAVRHLARLATDARLVILSGGDVRRFWRPLSGLGATVVFLDTHFYHLGDFLLVAADEPGFHTSTRLLTSPDGLEQVAAHVGAQRLLFGSRAPIYEPLVPMLRLATSTLSAEEKRMVAGGNAVRLLRADA